MRRGRGGKEKEWVDCVQSDIRAFDITADWKTMALKAEVWVEAVTEGGRRFMATWREEEEDAARHRQEKREATRLAKLQSHKEEGQTSPGEERGNETGKVAIAHGRSKRRIL